MIIVSDAPSWGITYDRHSDNSRGVNTVLENNYNTGVTHVDRHLR